MNRCLPRPRSLLAVLLLATCLLGIFPAAAQTSQRIPPIPASAQAGMLTVTAAPEVLLNGQPDRLSPGARIRGRNNLLLLSGTLTGQVLPVRYVRDMMGLIHGVWILNDDEIPASTR